MIQMLMIDFENSNVQKQSVHNMKKKRKKKITVMKTFVYLERLCLKIIIIVKTLETDY